MDNKFESFDSKTPPIEAKDSEITELNDQLQQEKDARKEERFCWILTCMVLLNVWFFEHISGWGVIGLVVLQFILLIILSRKLGIEYFTDILDKYGYNHPFMPIKKHEKTKE